MDEVSGSNVLFPSPSGQGGLRYVLGPSGLGTSDIKSAVAVNEGGQWLVRIVLTEMGASKWDALAQQQFHAIVGIVVNGKVISAPITEPVQSTFTSFGGEVQISGSFDKSQAQALAANL